MCRRLWIFTFIYLFFSWLKNLHFSISIQMKTQNLLSKNLQQLMTKRNHKNFCVCCQLIFNDWIVVKFINRFLLWTSSKLSSVHIYAGALKVNCQFPWRFFKVSQISLKINQQNISTCMTDTQHFNFNFNFSANGIKNTS